MELSSLLYALDWKPRIRGNPQKEYKLNYNVSNTPAPTWLCDNYAFYFASRTAWFFGVNSAFVAFGDIYDANNPKKKVGRHAFNIIYTKDDGLYLYDPMEGMEDGLTKVDKMIIKDWLYKPDWLLGF